MSEVQNMLKNQGLRVNLIGRKNIDLLAGGTAHVTEEELSSPHLQSFITKGYIKVLKKNIKAAQKDIGAAQKKTSGVIEKKKSSPEIPPSKSKPQKEDLKSEI